MTMPGADFDALAKMFGAAASATDLRRELDAMRDRYVAAERKIRAVQELCRDPGEAHRMLTRREILRLLA